MKKILIVDFGGQYKQLIARRVRECQIFFEIIDYQDLDSKVDNNTAGIIFTGGPFSVYEVSAPKISKHIFDLNIPILGICYGMQVIVQLFGGRVVLAQNKEFGLTEIKLSNHTLFDGIEVDNTCWMNHNDHVKILPDGFKTIANTSNCFNAAIVNDARKIYAVQFHPEVVDTIFGKKMFANFLFKICHLQPEWNSQSFIQNTISEIQNLVKNQKVICALSGGVDSAVAATLTHRAIGKNLICVFVNHGFMRYHEAEQVCQSFNSLGINFKKVDAKNLFFKALKGIVDPEKKRKIIGNLFIKVFEQQIKKMNCKISFLVQGTIYPDIVESGNKTTSTIKSHHNVGGLPKKMKLALIEPLRELFKDEVRLVGKELGLPNEIINRQPFPGPGLAVRVIGEVTPKKVKLLQLADKIFTEELARAGLSEQIWQYFACLPNVKTVGIKGDKRIHQHLIALRAVSSTDAMTAKYFPIPHNVLKIISGRIVSELDDVNRVVYDITSKPPATIEWE